MLLGIDTSGAVSVAVARGQLTPEATAPVEVLAVRSDHRSRHHDEVLLTLVDEVMAEAGLGPAQLEGVVVGRGPGPFTGLRVGLVSARTIAAVRALPLWGLCSLDALAHQAFAETPDARTAAVALDARRREIYHARYRRAEDGRILREHGPAVDPPAAVAADLRERELLVGSGTGLYPQDLPATSELAHVDAGHLIHAAAGARAAGEDLSSTDPLYLREPDAAQPTARKSALGK